MINIRASILPNFFDCPRRESLKIVPQEIEESGFDFSEAGKNVSAHIGTAFHAAAEDMILTSQSAGQILPELSIKQSIESGINTYYNEIKQTPVIFDEITLNSNEAEKQIKQLTGFYYNGILPEIELETVKTEVKYEKELDGALLTGHIDVQSKTQIRDLKSSKKANYLAQVGAYSLLSETESDLFVDFIPRTALRKVFSGIKIIKYDRSVAVETTHGIIKSIVTMANDFLNTGDNQCFPANPRSMLCSPKYCKAYKTKYCKLGGLN